jgi:hypothetical protein
LCSAIVGGVVVVTTSHRARLTANVKKKKKDFFFLFFFFFRLRFDGFLFFCTQMNRLLRMYSQLTSLLDRDRAEKENESESSFQIITAPLEYSRGPSLVCFCFFIVRWSSVG